MSIERERIDKMIEDPPPAKCPNCGKIVIPKRVDHFPNRDSLMRWCPICMKGKAGCYWL